MLLDDFSKKVVLGYLGSAVAIAECNDCSIYELLSLISIHDCQW